MDKVKDYEGEDIRLESAESGAEKMNRTLFFEDPEGDVNFELDCELDNEGKVVKVLSDVDKEIIGGYYEFAEDDFDEYVKPLIAAGVKVSSSPYIPRQDIDGGDIYGELFISKTDLNKAISKGRLQIKSASDEDTASTFVLLKSLEEEQAEEKEIRASELADSKKALEVSVEIAEGNVPSGKEQQGEKSEVMETKQKSGSISKFLSKLKFWGN